jgi:PAS domain S-box-containing protein
MSDKQHNSGLTPTDAAKLRKRAEEQARTLEPISLSAQTPETIEQILHELRVHQIELEMQNEELRTAQAVIEGVRARYFDLYDLAPVGYCTLSEHGLFLEANLTATTLLGVARSALVKQPISRFILKEDEDIYYLHRKQLFETGEPQEYVLRLAKPDGTLFWAHLVATIAQAEDGAPVCRVVLSDITERRRAEEAVTRSAEDGGILLNTIQTQIWYLTDDDTYGAVNKAHAEFNNLNIEDMAFKNMCDIFPEDTVEVCRQGNVQVFTTGKPVHSEEWMTHASGERRLISILKSPRLRADGTVEYVVCAAEDITERKQAEEALKKSERFLNSTIDGLTAHIAVLDDKGGIILTNKAYRDFAAQNGIDPRTVSEGANYLAVCDTASGEHSEEATPFAEGIRDVLSGKCRSFKLEYPCHSPSEDRWFIAHVTPFDDEGPRQVIVSHENITERKRAEDALREQRDFSESLVETAPSIILVLDTQGRIISFNPFMEKLVGYDLDEVKGMDWFETFLTPEISRTIKPLFQKSVDDIHTSGNVNPIITKDGRRILVEWNDKTLKDRKGRTVGMLAIGQDITKRKQTEAEREKLQSQLAQAQKAESIGRMAGAIAHIFNNQLGVVIGNLDMVIEDLPRDAKPVTNLTAAMQGARKAAQVSGLMLTYLGQTTCVHVPLDLSESCSQSLPSLRVGTFPGLILKVNVPSPGPTVSANITEIQQMLTNLVTNAREAIGEKQGTVTLTVRTVPQAEISKVHRYPTGWQAENATYACLEVADTGCGIVNEAIDKIFDPFYSTKFTGRGLGLPVVFGIVRAHDGVITVTSEEHGSTFRVFLPLSAEEIPRQPGKTAQPLARAGSGTVLLIEDEKMTRDMAKTMITRLGYTVLAAKDGIEAMEMFARHQDVICCVVSDVTMPRMNGWQTLAALRKLSPGIPVILSSGYDEAQVLIGDHPERPQAFLHKPYQKVELQAALAKAMTGLGYY